MADLAFRINPNIILGTYTVSRLAQQALEWGNRYMIVADPILVEMKIINKVTDVLNNRKIEHFVFSELSDGNSTKSVQRALTLAKEGHIHGIIAVGGIKALNIGLLTASLFNEAHGFYTFVDGAVPTTNAIPCICVPTTFREPYVFTNQIPISDSRNHQIKIMKVQNSICKLLLVDPNLMITLTENQKTTLKIELLSMVVEAYLSQKANFFSDMFAEKGMELLSYAINGSPSLDISTPAETLLAQAGVMISLASSSSSLGLGSMLALTINSRYQISKSLISSILLPYVIEDASKFKSARIEKIGRIMKMIPDDTPSETASKIFVDTIRQKIAKANLPARLKDLMLTVEQLSYSVEDCAQMDIINQLPRSMSTDELFDFVKSAY